VRIFLDTNVLVSSITTRGLCCELVENIIDRHELFTGAPVLRELERVLAAKFHLPARLIADFLSLIQTEGQVIPAPKTMPRLSFKDRDDIPILACVIAARPDVFVTGDKALLDLGSIEGIPILSPREIWQKLSGLENASKPK